MTELHGRKEAVHAHSFDCLWLQAFSLGVGSRRVPSCALGNFAIYQNYQEFSRGD